MLGPLFQPSQAVQTSSWCGSEGGWVPSRRLPGAHTPYLVIWAPSLGARPEGVPGPCPQRPSHDHHRTGAELGDAGLDPLLRGSTAGSGAASPGRAASRKPLSPRSPSPERPSAPPDRAPTPGTENGPAPPHKPLVSPHYPQPHPTYKQESPEPHHRPRRRTRCQEAIKLLRGYLAPHPHPSPSLLCRWGSPHAAPQPDSRCAPGPLSRKRPSAERWGRGARPPRPRLQLSPIPGATSTRLGLPRALALHPQPTIPLLLGLHRRPGAPLIPGHLFPGDSLTSPPPLRVGGNPGAACAGAGYPMKRAEEEEAEVGSD